MGSTVTKLARNICAKRNFDMQKTKLENTYLKLGLFINLSNIAKTQLIHELIAIKTPFTKSEDCFKYLSVRIIHSYQKL